MAGCVLCHEVVMLGWCLWDRRDRDHSLMIITAECWQISRAAAPRVSSSWTQNIDHLHTALHPKVGHWAGTSLWWTGSKVCSLLPKESFLGWCFFWKWDIFLRVGMKPAVVLLGLVLLLDATFAAEGKSSWNQIFTLNIIKSVIFNIINGVFSKIVCLKIK